MASLAEFEPLRVESIDSIRARIDFNTNAALDPTDPRWVDVTPGGFFFDHTQVMALEAELLWDMASTELPASLFLPFSWGIYLDYWGELLDVERKDEASATGEVTITNDPLADDPVVIGVGAEVAAPTSDPDAEPLAFLTTASATIAPGASAILPVQAENAGSEYNIGAGAVTLMLSADGVTVNNVNAMTGGADVEADEAYKARLMLEFSGSRGGGTVDDYVAEALSRPGIGSAKVEPRHAGPGTLRLILTDVNGSPLSVPALAAEQEYWDPVSGPGNGLGAAPINHLVTLATPAAVTPPYKLWLVLGAAYTITGAVGKEDVSNAITSATQGYINSLQAGDDILLSQLAKAALEVPGVYDVPKVTVNTVQANYAVGALQVARPGAITLTTDAP